MSDSRVIAVTGVDGYLGGLVAERFRNNSRAVIGLSRRPSTSTDESRRFFDLTLGPSEGLFHGVTTLIHAAWNLGSGDANEIWQQNVVGSRRLFEAASRDGVEQIFFVSSMSAYHGTRQTYGLMKLSVERNVLDTGHVVVRPGLVYGPNAAGMAGTLKKISSLPVWPAFRNSDLFLAHSDDLSSAFVKILDSYSSLEGQIVGLANPIAVSLSSLLTNFTANQKPRPAIRLPSKLVIAGLNLLEQTGIKLPFRSDSLLGLVEPAPYVPGAELCREMGIDFRELVPPKAN